MTTNESIWNTVASNEQLLREVDVANLSNVSDMKRLRKNWSVDEITIANELLGARKRARKKLHNADTLLADSIGVQQATSSQIAKHKSKRFVTNGPVFDLCCGIGSDLRELPAQTIGIDIDEDRCLMAESNSNKQTRCEDVLDFTLPKDSLIHIDPARREGASRLHALSDMKPNISQVMQIANQCTGGCIKVSPGVNVDDVEDFPLPVELEYIEEEGRVVQCAIWFGSLAQHPGLVTATSMSKHMSYSGTPDFATFSNNVHGVLLEPNPALERAGLHCNVAEEINAYELSPHLGLFCSADACDSDWFQGYEVLTSTPMRVSKVKQALQTLQCTQVEVKTRGKTIDPNQWQNELTTDSSGELLTIFALRLGKKRVAVLTRRL